MWERAFFISRSYGSCPYDFGWLVLAEGNACTWEQTPLNQRPYILFSRETTNVNWNDEANVGIADRMVIYIETELLPGGTFTGTFQDVLFSALQDKVEGTLDSFVKEAKEGLNSAGSAITNAHQACDAAVAAFNSAQADVDSAQLDFDNAVASLEGATQDVENEQAKFDSAIADLEEQQRNCQFRDCEWWDAPCHAINAGLAVCQAALEVRSIMQLW
ncbi:uncharacterized protein [Branchiostoma lanceolatum]|uniref:uncharacterized protein n=1 Tax=Branchiostoma lanceolatum TaxID=7740 RepID=UPI003452FDCB